MIIDMLNKGGGSSSADTATISGLLDRSITSVTIPSAVTEIGSYALAGCQQLEEMTFKADTPPTIASTALQDVTVSAVTVEVPVGSKDTYKAVEQLSGSTVIDGTEATCKITYNDGTHHTDVFDDGIIPAEKYKDAEKQLHIVVCRNVKEIGESAFNSSGTKTAIFNNCNELTTIGDSSFAYTGLENINLPDSVTSIGSFTFCRCYFETIKLPKSLTKISNGMFYDTFNLTGLTIPSSVTTIGSQAFNGSGIKSIDIPDSVTSIDSWAFCDSKLESVNFGKSITAIPFECFLNCKSLKTLTIPSNITYLQGNCFSTCTSLTSLVIESGCTTIDGGVFNSCSSLSSVTFEAVTAPSVGGDCFTNLPSSGTLHLPQGYTGYDSIIDTYFSNWTIDDGTVDLLTFKLQDGTTEVHEIVGHKIDNNGHKYANRTDIVEIVISDGIKKIGEWQFSGLANLTAVTLPANVETGQFVFNNCTSLKSVTIPNGCNIDRYVFGSCTALETVIVGDNVTLSGNAFENCPAITSVTFGNDVNIGDNTFSGMKCDIIYNNKLIHAIEGVNGEYVVADGVENIGRTAFYETSNLTSLILPTSLTYITQWAFMGSPSGMCALTSVTFNSVTAPEVGSDIFSNLPSSGTLHLPQGYTGYDDIISTYFSGWTIESGEPSSDSTTVYIWQKDDADNTIMLNDEGTQIIVCDSMNNDNMFNVLLDDLGTNACYFDINESSWHDINTGEEMTDEEKTLLSALMDYENATVNTSAGGTVYVTVKIYKAYNEDNIDSHFLEIPE